MKFSTNIVHRRMRLPNAAFAAGRRANRCGSSAACHWTSADEAHALVAELGDCVLALCAGVTDEAQADGACAQALQRFGGIDTLVANAALYLSSPAASFNTAEVIEVNDGMGLY
jgi:NAD(P)-dependent dehydrogenase (short-subunit alcohol dehydrogenase family)